MVVALQERQNKRAPYEFSKDVVIQGLKECGFACERCGIKKRETLDGYLEAHHRLPIHVVLKHFPHLSAIQIKSLANLEILCVECHRAEHQNEDLGKYCEFAQYFEQQMELAKRASVSLGSGGRRRI